MHRQSIWTPPHQDCRCPLFLHGMFFLLPFLLQSSQFILASDRHQIMLACIPICVCVRLYRHAWQRHSVTGLLSNSLVRDDVKPVLKLLVLYDLRQYLFKTQTRTHTRTHARTHTHTFNGPFSRTTQVSRCQKGKTNLDFSEVRDSEWQWHQLDHMQVCTLLQTDNHASTSPLCFLQAGCPSCCPTNSVKALKAET